MGKRLEQALAEQDEIEAAAADHADQPIPPHVKVSRPNRALSRVLQVRLDPDEFEAIERIAAERGLPASTVARERLLAMIAEDQADDLDVAAQVAAAADRIKELVARGVRT
ncbi:CopG family transcriptional regulator [Mycobacterium hubeiense]|uniref:CopG family transcriptional regulator n=1 Tax=Mycobacterium hubeiense TaxID=1867256 RepID=UPI001E5FE498|nr:CopG family transcriptional regulator [Mycobacterium sp. QGD 101]